MAITAKIHDSTIHVGDTVSVNYKIIEKEVVAGKTKREKHEEQKERTQAFTGMVLAIRGTGDGKNFVVRHMGVGNVGVERIFPLISPWIKSVKVVKRGGVNQARLYYLRNKTAKETARISRKNEIVTPKAPAPVVAKEKADEASQPQPAQG